VTGPEARALVAAARHLMAWSGVRDAELAARLAAERQAFAAGVAEGDRLGRVAVHDFYAAERREVSAAVAAILSDPAELELERARWHVCCSHCRRNGCAPGCQRCENRTRETFAAPHPDDFRGSLVAAA
jgi:hypothetical protein